MLNPNHAELLNRSWLGRFPSPVVTTLSRHAHCRWFASKTSLFRQGDKANAFYIIVSGHVRLFRSGEEGEDWVLSILGPGRWFGELSVLDGKPRLVSAECVGATQLLVVPASTLVSLLRRDPSLLWHLANSLCDNVRAALETLEEGMAQSGPARLARRLLTLAEHHGRADPDGVVIDLPLSHLELSRMVGLARPTVSSLLSQWKRAGILLQRDRLIMILQPRALRAVA